MPLFAYTALNQQGDVVRGVVQAPTAQHIAAVLPGLTLIDQKLANPPGWKHQVFTLLYPPLHPAEFFGHLATFLHYKMTLTEALSLVAVVLPRRAATIVMSLQEYMRQGASFADALASVPKLFSSFVLSTLRSAEETGCLASSCALLQEFFKVQDHLLRQERKAIAYPICVFLTVLGVLTVLLRVLVPSMRTLFEGSDNPELDLGQRFLFALSDLAVDSPGLFVFGMLTLLGIFGGAYHVFVHRHTTYEGVLGLHTFSILLQAGIPLKEALDLVREGAQKKARHALDALIRQVTSGLPLHKALAASSFFPSCAAKFAELGEASGALGMMLARGAQFERERAVERSRRRIALIQPILLGCLGALILWIIATMFVPLYSRMAEL